MPRVDLSYEYRTGKPLIDMPPPVSIVEYVNVEVEVTGGLRLRTRGINAASGIGIKNSPRRVTQTKSWVLGGDRGLSRGP